MTPFSSWGATSAGLLERFAAEMAAGPLATLVDPLRRSGNATLAFLRGGHGQFDDSTRRDDNPLLGRIGDLEVRLATSSADVKRAQRLRYRVFYEEMSAVPGAAALIARRDMDAFDAICDHLLVLDHSTGKSGSEKSGSGKSGSGKSGSGRSRFGASRPEVVGTYRLLRQDVASRHAGFYTAREYAIGPVLASHPGMRVLELGRSCVLKPYRNKRTVELLWHGIWTYVLRHRIDVMLGCASLEGTDPEKLALPLSFLHHYAAAPTDWRARAHDHLHVPMDRIARHEIDPKQAIQSLPPLIKGYLRIGATFGDGAVVDRQFGTTDVLVVLPVSAINPRYIGHSELLDGRMRTLLSGFAEGWIWERCLRVMEEMRRDVFEVFYDRDGIKAWFRITASPITSGFMLSVADISDLKQALVAAEEARRDAEATQATLRRLSLTDALTGLLNRRGFEEMVRMQQANLNRYGAPSALVAIDIDHFKHVNDTFGHAAGDGVLMAIASIFREETRLDLDMAGRVGGEEFMLLLPGSGLSGAQVLAERIRSRIGNEVLTFEGAAIHISASFGVSAFRADREPEATIRAADKALYEAKRRGRNQVVVEEREAADARGECAQ